MKDESFTWFFAAVANGTKHAQRTHCAKRAPGAKVFDTFNPAFFLNIGSG